MSLPTHCATLTIRFLTITTRHPPVPFPHSPARSPAQLSSHINSIDGRLLVVGSSTTHMAQAIASVGPFDVPAQDARPSARSLRALQRCIAHRRTVNATPAIALPEVDMRAAIRLALRQREFLRVVRQTQLPRLAALAQLLRSTVGALRSELIEHEAVHLLVELSAAAIDANATSVALVVRALKADGSVCALPHKEFAIDISGDLLQTPFGVARWSSDKQLERRRAVLREVCALFDMGAWRSGNSAPLSFVLGLSRQKADFLHVSYIESPAQGGRVVLDNACTPLGRLGQLAHNGVDLLRTFFASRDSGDAAAANGDAMPVDGQSAAGQGASASAAAAAANTPPMTDVERLALRERLQTLNLSHFKRFAAGLSDCCFFFFKSVE